VIVAAGKPDAAAAIDAVLARYATIPEPGKLSRQRATIERCFAPDRVEDILSALDQDCGAFATNAAAAMRAASPTSLKLTREALRRGETLGFDDCLKMEYRLTQSILAESDFYEGVRAQLVDKDRKPQWQPALLAAVDDGAIDDFFQPPPWSDLIFENRAPGEE
jgi:enoyl-CoA hydratase